MYLPCINNKDYDDDDDDDDDDGLFREGVYMTGEGGGGGA